MHFMNSSTRKSIYRASVCCIFLIINLHYKVKVSCKLTDSQDVECWPRAGANSF